MLPCSPLLCILFILVSNSLYVAESVNLSKTETRNNLSTSSLVTLQWGVETVTCTDNCTQYTNCIPSVGSYACSDGRGQWNATGSFFDPLPPTTGKSSFVVTQIELDVVGRFNCNNRTQGPQVNFTIQGLSVNPNSNIMPSQPYGCDCLACMNHFHLVSDLKQNGWPNYSYGSLNTLSIQSDNTNVICLDYINITVYYVAVVFPEIITMYPSSGPVSGSTFVEIYAGDPGFVQNVSYCCIFGDPSQTCVPATFDDVQHITCASPPGEPGFFEVYLKIVADGGYVDTQLKFQYYPSPVLYSLQPSKSYSGENITVVGANFSNLPSSRLLFGGQVVNVDFISDTSLIVTVPEGSGHVFVNLSQNGQQYSEGIAFSYLVNSHSKSGSSFPSWIWVVLIFGGLTAIIVVILLICKRSPPPRDQGETTSLLSVNDSMFIKQIDITSVKILHRIGKGTFGEVFKGIWNGTEVAIKFLNAPSVVNDQFLQDFNKEVMIMRGCRHPNVLQFLGASTNLPNICIVMEYMPLGSLYKILHEDSIKLELEMIRKMMLDAARGLNYLHKSNPVIIHRDLKSHNLLVDENWKVKVCDFGLSKIMEINAENNNMTACGTPSWTAPEILRNEKYTEKADVYSFGIVLWECITRQDPYEGMPPFQVVLQVGTKGMRPTIPSNCSRSWYSLMTDCWAELPESRPSFDEIMLRLEEMAPRLH